MIKTAIVFFFYGDHSRLVSECVGPRVDAIKGGGLIWPGCDMETQFFTSRS